MIRGPLKEKLLLTIRIHICCPWQNSHLNQKEITLFNFIMTNQKFYNSTKKLNSNVTNDILHFVFFFYGSTFESIFGGCKAKRRLELRCLSLPFFPHAFYAIVVVKLKPQQSQIYVVLGPLLRRSVAVSCTCLK